MQLESWREIEWATKLHREGLRHKSTTCISQSKAKKGKSITPAAVDLLTEPAPSHSYEPRAEQWSWNRENLFYLKQDWSAQPLDFWKLSKVIQCRTIFNPNRHLPHPPTSERCLDCHKSSVIGDRPLPTVPLISITFQWTLSDLFLQRNRSFRTCEEPWRTCGELWLYFEMQRRLGLRSFSWLSRSRRVSQNQLSFPFSIGRSYRSPPLTLNGYWGVILQSTFKPNISLQRSFPDLQRPCFVFVNPTRNGERWLFKVCRRIDSAIDQRLRLL